MTEAGRFDVLFCENVGKQRPLWLEGRLTITETNASLYGDGLASSSRAARRIASGSGPRHVCSVRQTKTSGQLGGGLEARPASLLYVRMLEGKVAEGDEFALSGNVAVQIVSVKSLPEECPLPRAGHDDHADVVNTRANGRPPSVCACHDSVPSEPVCKAARFERRGALHAGLKQPSDNRYQNRSSSADHATLFGTKLSTNQLQTGATFIRPQSAGGCTESAVVSQQSPRVDSLASALSTAKPKEPYVSAFLAMRNRLVPAHGRTAAVPLAQNPQPIRTLSNPPHTSVSPSSPSLTRTVEPINISEFSGRNEEHVTRGHPSCNNHGRGHNGPQAVEEEEEGERIITFCEGGGYSTETVSLFSSSIGSYGGWPMSEPSSTSLFTTGLLGAGQPIERPSLERRAGDVMGSQPPLRSVADVLSGFGG